MSERLRGHLVSIVSVAAGDRTYQLLVPTDPEELLESPAVAERFARDEYMPYWATLWPAAFVLAEVIGAGPDLNNIDILELGAGVGLVGLVAAGRGGRVTISDYDGDAIAFALENARRNNLPTPCVANIDWRRSYPERYDCILAADVLYEARNLEPVARFVAEHLTEGGQALICDANRSTCDPFEQVAREAGLNVDVRANVPATDVDGQPVTGRVYYLRR